MDNQEFHRLLANASDAAIAFACHFVENELPDSRRYRLLLNQSHDGNATDDDALYPLDSGVVYQDLEDTDVVKILWRDHAVPQWIDISVCGATKERTLLELRCCGRFTKEQSRLYYTKQGTGPFGIKSPALPSQWNEKHKFYLPFE